MTEVNKGVTLPGICFYEINVNGSYFKLIIYKS